MQNKSVSHASNMQQLLSQMNNVSGLKIVGGCTAISEIPEKFISVRFIPELAHIDKHERYINFGAAVTLSEIIDVASNRVPTIFIEAIKSIANPNIRNIATLGGNICMEENGRKQTLYAPLLALDARLEIRSPTETKYESLINFKGVGEKFVVTHIRIPTTEWDVSIFRRIGPSHKITDASASFAFLASSEKNVITDIRIALAGRVTFRAKNLAAIMAGMHLPLTEKNIEDIKVGASSEFKKNAKGKTYPDTLRTQFMDLVEYSIEQLT